MKRRAFLIGALAAPVVAAAQTRRFRIGWLTYGGVPLGPADRTLIDALAQRGLFDGRELTLIFRHAGGVPSRLPTLAAELMAEKPDLLMALGGDVIGALLDASSGTVPVVGGVSENPLRNGMAETFARPGKNFTGVTYITDELAPKRMELLTQVAPDARRVAAIWNPQHVDDEIAFALRAAEWLGITLTSHPVINLGQVDQVLAEAKIGDADGMFVIPSRLIGIAVAKIAPYARERRLPVVSAWREFVDDGFLMSYGPNRAFESTRLADYVEKIMAGAKPRDLPIQQPTKFELVINLQTATALGLEIPPALLARADDLVG
jgi:putative ABC transport system substrate-binding protein